MSVELAEEEYNYEAAGSWDEDNENIYDGDDYKITDLESVERTNLNTTVEYVQRWVLRTKIEVLQNITTNSSYTTHKELFLFNMFMYRSLFEQIRQWTNGNMP